MSHIALLATLALLPSLPLTALGDAHGSSDRDPPPLERTPASIGDWAEYEITLQDPAGKSWSAHAKKMVQSITQKKGLSYEYSSKRTDDPTQDYETIFNVEPDLLTTREAFGKAIKECRASVKTLIEPLITPAGEFKPCVIETREEKYGQTTAIKRWLDDVPFGVVKQERTTQTELGPRTLTITLIKRRAP